MNIVTSSPPHPAPKVVWVGPRAADTSLVPDWLPVTHIFSGDAASPGLLGRALGFSLEETSGIRERWGSSSLDKIVARFSAEFERSLVSGSVIVPYTTSEQITHLAARSGVRSLGPPWRLREWLDDKRNFVAVLDLLGIRRLPYHIVPARRLDASLARDFGGVSRLVVQTPRGSAGSGTYFVENSPARLRTIAQALGDREILVAPYVEGSSSVNVHFSVIRKYIIQSAISLQLIGLPECTRLDAGFCGSDFAAAAGLDQVIIDGIREMTEQIARYLGSLGYEGIGGIDFIVDRVAVSAYPIDLNPRFQASSRLLAEGERAARPEPRVLRHCAWSGTR